ASLMQLAAYDRSGEQVRALEEKGYYNDFTVSPDGKFAAVNVSDPESGSNDIWIIDLESEVQTRLTFGQEEELSPAWSPDGAEILYHAFEGNERVLYRKSVLGGSDKVEVHRSESIQLWPTAWHPDSAFVICSASDNNLWLVPLDPEREPVQWTDTDYLERSASFSPDGRWLAYSSDETGRLHAYVTAFPEGGRRWQVSGSEEGNAPKFDAQHTQILYYGIKLAKVMRAGYEVSGDDLQILRPEILLDARRSIKSDVTRDGNRIWMIESLEESGGLPVKLVLNWRELLRI
ncbi:MAG: hypothetical protein HKN20_00800, partial [Gemmatimonadetes bacterium]|nr:hypothetical protein [Gemmatimonadota bacterium]